MARTRRAPSPPRVPPRLRTPLALGAGLALPLAFAPFGLWWLMPLLIAVAVACWRGSPPRRAALSGFAFGAGAFLAGTYWVHISIHVFGNSPLWLSLGLMLGMVAIMALYYALAAFAIALLDRHAPRWALATVPGVWVLVEWLRGWLFSGFPWLALGYSQTDGPLAPLAPLGGVYASSFAVALIGVALQEAAVRRGRRRLATAAVPLTIAIVLPLASLSLGAVDWTAPSGRVLTASMVQLSVPQERKWLPEELRPTLRRYRELTLANNDKDIVVWPEAAVPRLRSRVAEYLRALDRDASPELLIGIPDHDPERDTYSNSVIVLGAEPGEYAKRHLVPFGEYFPVPPAVREWMRLRNMPNTDMTPGAPDQPPLVLAGEPVAVSICYEDAFGAEQRHYFPQATLIVNVSNDAWFGDSIAPHQHLQIARMRSMEAGREQLRATNTGISAFIDAEGRILRRAPQFEPAVLSGPVHPRTGATPFVRYGNLPVLLLALAALTPALAALARTRRQPARPSAA